jgi:hypothetical protein
MAEPPKSNRPLPDLVRFLGAPDGIEPVNRHLFARKVVKSSRERAPTGKSAVGPTKKPTRSQNAPTELACPLCYGDLAPFRLQPAGSVAPCHAKCLHS